MLNTIKLKKELKKFANPEYAKILQKFFKTGKGEYGEGDIFLGIKTPIKRKIVKDYQELSLCELQKLISDKIHDFRFSALLILIAQFKTGGEKKKKEIFKLYLKSTKYINNWDLVDISAPHIVGNFLLDKPRDVLYKLAKSKNLWERRIAIVSTFFFIRNSDFIDTLKISEILLSDDHDLIYKATGWMLREVGKKDLSAEEKFLQKHCQKMPRVALRYAIERFNKRKRKVYLKKIEFF
ncbi:DNA alkylation repair protein [Candidatus Parcubacteria bacterium]|nr:DNA alkylation repair protein [Candidatus Parcubacteria bacterium]